ncbi:hypothetical protein [Pseudomonas sp. ANT_J12]|uniref:hypothetical protein n=1 Tax=Pseudomonas sp. ANT_J12 TaxID=2597351 RepID=UPI0015B5B798|nr:hypothetical protein [Pseudomonas sp. ANT_J12]
MLIVPTLCVGMHHVTLCVTSRAERGASVAAFPRRAWERSNADLQIATMIALKLRFLLSNKRFIGLMAI